MQDIAVIINNKAKNHSESSSYLDEFNKANIPHTLYETAPEHLAATIKKCIIDYQIILIGGGDGTIRTAAHYCAHTPIILGVVAQT